MSHDGEKMIHRLRISNAEIVVISEALNKLASEFFKADTCKKHIINITRDRFQWLRLDIDERILGRAGGSTGLYHGKPRREKYYDDIVKEFWQEYSSQVKAREGVGISNGTVTVTPHHLKVKNEIKQTTEKNTFVSHTLPTK